MVHRADATSFPHHKPPRLWRRIGRFGLRSSLLIVLLPLLSLPWLGLRFVERMAEVARDERLENQSFAARSLAAVLHERPELFRDSPVRSAPLPAGTQPVQVSMLAEVLVDGRTDEWADASRIVVPVTPEPGAPPDTLKLQLALARSQESPGRLFLLIEATDERLVRPADEGAPLPGGASETSPEAGDQLIVESGPSATQLKAMPVLLRARPGGWLAELQLAELPAVLRVRALDVDYQGSRRIEAQADTGLLSPVVPVLPMSVSARGELWQETMKALSRASGRISVFDRGGALLATKGSLGAGEPPPAHWSSGLARWLLNIATRLKPGSLEELPKPVATGPTPAARTALSPMNKALSGAEAQQSQRVADVAGMPTWLLTSAQPVWVAEDIVAVLLLEESTAARLLLGQQALEQLALLAALAIAATVLSLLGVASSIVARIVRLRRDAEAAIDERGRVVRSIRPALIQDELGALRASYARVLERLHAHQDYLGKLRSRLMHELRTPIMVVRSSLENLVAEQNPAQRDIYIERVQSGAARLERMVASMGEAASLETMLNEGELERVDLDALVRTCLEGYRAVFAPRRFEYAGPGHAAPAEVAPEAIVQALDKLVSNADDFARADTPVLIRLVESEPGGRIWRFSVINQGPSLPSGMEQAVFEQMVSIRQDRSDQRTHLGLGLYLVRLIAEFHGGRAWARNLERGVEVGFDIRAR